MPLWAITTESVSPDQVGSFEPIKVLFDFDCLTTFSCLAADGGLLLAHVCDEDGGERRFVVVPTTERMVSQLDRGELPIRTALAQARVWLVDLDSSGKAIRAFATTFDDIPADCLPTPTATFLVDEPNIALSLRAMGQQIRDKVTPASVVKATTNSAYAAMKRLVDYVSASNPEWATLPASSWRPFYDLPTHSFLAASFEVRFGWPRWEPHLGEPVSDKDFVDKVQGELSRLLAAGVKWCANSDSDQPLGKTQEETRAILEAMEQLSPPQTGSYIEQMQVGGRIATTTGRVVLTKANRKEIRGRLDSERSPKPWTVWAAGVIDAADRGLGQFTLRKIDALAFSERLADAKLQNNLHKEITFGYNEELEAIVLEAFDSSVRVYVQGRTRTFMLSKNAYTLHSISIAGPTDEVDQEYLD